MSIFDTMPDVSQTNLGGTDLQFIDADTLKDSQGAKYRIKGISAPETFKEGVPGQEFQEAGALQTQEQVMNLANSQGFTNVKHTGEYDQFGREVVDLYNDKGQSFSRMLTNEGIVDIHHDYDTGGTRQRSKEFAAALKTNPNYRPTEWDQARDILERSIRSERRGLQQFKRAQEYSGQIGDLEIAYNEIINDPDTPEDERTYFKNKLARVKRQFNDQVSPDLNYSDRDDISGESLNPLSDAWDTGWIGMQESLWGTLNMLGETTDWDWAADMGEAGVARAQAAVIDKPRFLVDYKDIDSFWDFTSFVANNAAISVPYMAATAGAAVASAVAAPVVGVVGATTIALSPAAIYAGQTWNEMEGEKDAGVAVAAGIAQATLDRLGLGVLIKGAGQAPKQLMKDAVEALVKQGVARDAAEQQVAQASRRALADFAGDAAKVAGQQLSAKAISKDMLTRFGIGAAGEGVTEAMQEATAYLGATIGSDKVFDWNELNDRMVAAAVAGSSLGGSLSVPGSLYNTGAWADVAVRQSAADPTRLSQAGKYAEDEVKEHGRVLSVKEIVDEQHSELAAGGVEGATLEERRQAHAEKRKAMSSEDKVVDALANTPSLWRKSVGHIFSAGILAQSRTARMLNDMLGGGLQKTFSGAHYENEKHHRVSMYKNMVGIPDATFAMFNGGKRPTRKQKNAISKQIYETLQGAMDDKKQINWDTLKDHPQYQQLQQVATDLKRLSDKMWADQKKYNPELGFQENYLLRYKALDKGAVKKHRDRFIRALVDSKGFTYADAKKLTDEILENNEVSDIDDAFSIVEGGGGRPTAHKERTINLSEDPEFQDFMEQDMFANISHAAKSAAKYTARQDFVGANGEVIAHMLNKIQAEGVDPEIVNKMAKQITDYLDAESGNYKRPTSEAGKAAHRIQRHFMFFTTLAGLPLATVSSIVEIALSMRGLTKEQMFGADGKGGIKKLMQETGNHMVSVMAKGDPDGVDRSDGMKILRNLGFYDWDVGAATTTGVTEINAWQQQWYERFFQYTGLQGWTNYTRAVRASIAGDYMYDHLNTILKADPDAKTNEVQEAEEALRNLGINVQDMVNFEQANVRGEVTPEMQEAYDAMMREAVFNFINDAVALPQSGNRPLIYQDPRFALFTQFQGFMSTFTANHIPKLWGEYVKRGTPSMKYNAFAVMTTMVALGFLSQHLKDLIKYKMGFQHFDEKTGANPYLDTPEYLQRGVRASGLLGTGERVLDLFFPIYDQRSGDVGDWAFNTATGEAPAIGNLQRIGRGAGHILGGDIGKGTEQFLKSTPGFGPFSNINRSLTRPGSSWNNVLSTVEDVSSDWNYGG